MYMWIEEARKIGLKYCDVCGEVFKDSETRRHETDCGSITFWICQGYPDRYNPQFEQIKANVQIFIIEHGLKPIAKCQIISLKIAGKEVS
jgi:hypothetical protein